MNKIRDICDWDTYYMMVACVAISKSHDPNTRHGAIVVNAEYRPLGFGFNGFPKGSKDDTLYPTSRPEKYKYMIHAEENAIDHCNVPTKGGTIYVTGHPCSRCMLKIAQNDIVRVIYGNIDSACVSMEDMKAVELICLQKDIEIINYAYDLNRILDVIESTTSYLRERWVQK